MRTNQTHIFYKILALRGFYKKYGFGFDRDLL